MTTKKQLKKQSNQLINKSNKNVETIVNDEQASFLFYKLSNGKKISFTAAIDEISKQINLYNQIVDEKNTVIEKLKKLNSILIDRDKEITFLKNKLNAQIEKVVEVPVDKIVKVEVPVEKVVYVNRIVEVRKSIKVPPKPLLSSLIFNDQFKVECYKLKRDIEKVDKLPKPTIPLTKQNINLICSQFKCGVGKSKKKTLKEHLDKINFLDDLPSLKIGIGKRTVEKLKRFFHISTVHKLVSNNIDVLVNDYNSSLSDSGFNRFEDLLQKPSEKNVIVNMVKSLKNFL
jgi:hypothetical protein